MRNDRIINNNEVRIINNDELIIIIIGNKK